MQTETLNNLSPGLLANVGVLVMGRSDVGWRMQLAMWVERRSNSDRALMRTLTEVRIEQDDKRRKYLIKRVSIELFQTYVESIVQYLADMSRLAMYGGPTDRQRFKRVVWQSNENMICTLTRLLEVRIVQSRSKNISNRFSVYQPSSFRPS